MSITAMLMRFAQIFPEVLFVLATLDTKRMVLIVAVSLHTKLDFSDKKRLVELVANIKTSH